MSSMIETDIFDDRDELTEFAAQKFVAAGRRALADSGIFRVALSGGSTPRALYRLLASDKYRAEIDVANTHFYFGDERNVPAGDDRSNFRMANETLFEPLKVPEANIFRWKTELQPNEAAAEYAATLRETFNEELPRFDLILLGLGTDGHTASLFPNTPATRESELIAAANPVESLGEIRLTVTFPLINNASNVIFLIIGKDKASAAKNVFEGDFRPDELPAQFVSPANGSLYRLLDADAAALLTSE